jgi:site-specific recombinase XerD
MTAEADALLEEFGAHLEAVHGLAPATVRNYRLYVRCFLDWWHRTEGETLLSAVEPRHLTTHLVAEAQRGIVAGTRYSAVYGLKAFFRFLTDTGRIAASPATALRPPKKPPGRLDTYRPEEIARIFDHLHGLTDLRGRQRVAILAVFRFTGLRVSEVGRLRLDDVDLPQRRMEVVGKGGRHRLVVISHPLHELLDTFLAHVRPQLPPSPWLFVNPHPFVTHPEGKFSYTSLEAEVERAGVGAGVPGRHYPHKWRHTFATELVRAGVDLRTVQLLMGHVSITSTTLYTHLDDGDLRSAMDGVYPCSRP